MLFDKLRFRNFKEIDNFPISEYLSESTFWNSVMIGLYDPKNNLVEETISLNIYWDCSINPFLKLAWTSLILIW